MEPRKVHFTDSNRIGKFNLVHEVLQDGRERPMLQALFGLCVILETYPHESGRGTVYVAASELFEPLAEGEEIPQYRIEMARQQPFERDDWEQRRLNSGDFGFVAIRKLIVRVPTLAVQYRPRLIH